MSKYILILILLLLSSAGFSLNGIKDFRRSFLVCNLNKVKDVKMLGLREFKMNGVDSVLLLDVQTLKTHIQSKAMLACTSADANFLNNTVYQKLRSVAASSKKNVFNAGLSQMESNRLFLTVDLCPSKRAFEKDFFDTVRTQKIPIGIAISGGWIKAHATEFEKVKVTSSNITWINHTLNHPYVHELPDEKNFLLLPNVNLEQEVIGNEILMLENGLVPSVFLRFPGLISSAEIVDKVISWGLIPIGSNAWLALDQKAKKGSIILLHGNGNEAPGIKLFFQNLKQFISLGFASLAF